MSLALTESAHVIHLKWHTAMCASAASHQVSTETTINPTNSKTSVATEDSNAENGEDYKRLPNSPRLMKDT